MSFTFTPLPPKTRVYKFGVVWHWKCEKPRCAGGRERDWEKAVAKANEHAKSHAEED